MQDNPTALLKKHGKSFNFARFFLGSDTGIAAARLYRFCRIVDDIADENEDKVDAAQQLTLLKQQIVQNQKTDPIIGDFLALCSEYGIDRNHGITLIEGVSQDLIPLALASEKMLIQYAYRVAGVVGLMMAPILGAKKVGYAFAVDLGIGMQLTNIARDVMEDAQMQRRYIPADWVGALSAEQIANSELADREVVQKAIQSLLQLAETYYQSGLSGLYYLPARNRRAIAVAAFVYRDIGRKLLSNHCIYWQGRVIVSTPRKLQLACQALWQLTTSKLAHTDCVHANELHLHLPSDTHSK
ncbi:MAG: phytoene synthase [Glaciecola sp.]|jgi:phytoene synthase